MDSISSTMLEQVSMKQLTGRKKAFERDLISEDQYQEIMKELRKLPKEINTLIKLTMENLEA